MPSTAALLAAISSAAGKPEEVVSSPHQARVKTDMRSVCLYAATKETLPNNAQDERACQAVTQIIRSAFQWFLETDPRSCTRQFYGNEARQLLGGS